MPLLFTTITWSKDCSITQYWLCLSFWLKQLRCRLLQFLLTLVTGFVCAHAPIFLLCTLNRHSSFCAGNVDVVTAGQRHWRFAFWTAARRSSTNSQASRTVTLIAQVRATSRTCQCYPDTISAMFHCCHNIAARPWASGWVQQHQWHYRFLKCRRYACNSPSLWLFMHYLDVDRTFHSCTQV